jgi:hypothetical protein
MGLIILIHLSIEIGVDNANYNDKQTLEQKKVDKFKTELEVDEDFIDDGKEREGLFM